MVNHEHRLAAAYIRVGMIGLGRFSQFHLKCLRQLPNVKLVAAADLSETRRLETAQEWGCTCYASWQEMIDSEKLDAVIVLTPEMHHVEPTLAALQAGCHVFVEKPIALTEQDAERMIETAKQNNRLLMVGHVLRFDPRMLAARQAVQQGEVGKVRSIYSRRNNPSRYFSLYERTNLMYILGIHDIDLQRWMTGAEVVEVFARSSSSTGNGPDLIWAMLTFSDGTIGVIENNWLISKQAPAEMDVRMEIVGEEGIIHFQDPDQSLVFWSGNGVTHRASYIWNEAHDSYAGYILEEMKHFYQCVRDNTPSPILLLEDAKEAVRVAEAIILSSQTGQPVRLAP
ncbi:Gfo/Idh/MocA family protein [Paenibacillus sp. PAMC21692]|uniref:Gfo/Idh/MocA family protein n=1 Tax=Paenibacillus sp. PAMC21692 TaxID=2762320 RepID=UPI00164D5D66|nr:Gfo/Idh/MocA family oxidoreductase [Paenibacillus sp. PAMC21692]QNK59254.1 Gfo/Idh/MocA family oxidoreductase [Paenibacillus sp. PAMC21692]